MRILMAHNRYQHAGGEDAVVALERAMLVRRGHDVQLLVVDNDSIAGFREQMTAGVRSFYSRPSFSLLTRELQQFRPEILHGHNLFPQFSPSVYFAAKEAGVPVVQTLHNYRLICANAQLFRDNKPCEDCPSAHSMWPGVKHACYRGSRVGSFIVGAGTSLHGALGTWRTKVDRYIALTQFAASKLSRSVVPAEHIRVKPNFTDDVGEGTGAGGFALFVGRLSREKGIDVLIEADAQGVLPLPVYVAGSGPMEGRLREACDRPGSRLRALGSVSSDEVRRLMKEAVALLLPSLWYEGCPMVAIEAMSTGLPILAADLGSLPEMVEHGATGLLFPPGQAHSLGAALSALLALAPAQLASMRRAARARYLERYTEEANYRMLLGIYNEVLDGRAESRHQPEASYKGGP